MIIVHVLLSNSISVIIYKYISCRTRYTFSHHPWKVGTQLPHLSCTREFQFQLIEIVYSPFKDMSHTFYLFIIYSLFVIVCIFTYVFFIFRQFWNISFYLAVFNNILSCRVTMPNHSLLASLSFITSSICSHIFPIPQVMSVRHFRVIWKVI